jgi:hypothetical protein
MKPKPLRSLNHLTLPCIIAFLLLSQNFSRADYDDAKKNHHTLKSAVVKPTLQNVFIQPLMHTAG